MALTRLRLSEFQLILLASAFILLTANMTFFSEVLNIYPLTLNSAGFLTSLTVFVWAGTVVLLSFLTLLMPLRVALGGALLLAAVTGYFSDEFGVVMDTVMLQNMVETDVSEASDLLSVQLIIRVFLFGFLPLVLLWRLPSLRQSLLVVLPKRLVLLGAALVIMVLCVVSFSASYASFFREHKQVRYYVNPITPVYALFKYAQENITVSVAPVHVAMAMDAVIPSDNAGKELVIVVVGETARQDRFSLNGYARNTNPLLSAEKNLISFSNVTACGTSTAVSVPCMFAINGRSDYERSTALNQDNVLDILNRVGVSILWRDNNSSSKGVADRVAYQNYRTAENNTICDTECRDEGMLVGLQQYINDQPGDVLIVLHQMGNHGPAYYKRYPQAFEHFKPACHSQELSECSEEEINNAYDNAILYTDYFLSKVINLLKKNTPEYETAMIYVSDHGESLGENGLYLHGMPYAFAPDEQTQVPLVLWAGESSDIDLRDTRKRQQYAFSHDAIYHSLLSVFEVQAESVDRQQVLFVMQDKEEDVKLVQQP